MELCKWLRANATEAPFAPDWSTLTAQARSGDALEALAENRDATGIIVARRARTDELAFVRLGRTARQLIGSSDRPTIVVPPEMEARDIPSGPLVAGVSPLPDDIAVARHAALLATLVGRPIHLVHVRTSMIPTAAGSPGLLGPVGPPLPGSVDTWLDRLEEWAASFGLDSARCSVVLQPGVVDALRRYASRHDACMIAIGAAGSRGPIERLFVPNRAAELASRAGRPVAVIPRDLHWN